jgi:hypothetical protein
MLHSGENESNCYWVCLPHGKYLTLRLVWITKVCPIAEHHGSYLKQAILVYECRNGLNFECVIGGADIHQCRCIFTLN